jgi:hypothetical protein
MAKWLTVFILVATLSANALAGFAMHPAESGCSMPDCCEKARAQEHTPEQMAAQMCCALNCPQPAPTGQAGGFNFAPLIVTSLHPASLTQPAVVPSSDLCFHSTPLRSSDSHPAYIRHLALLI